MIKLKNLIIEMDHISYWISPEGKFIRIKNFEHVDYALKILKKTYPIINASELYKEMFDKGWIIAIVEYGEIKIDIGLHKFLIRLSDLPFDQRQSIKNYAETYKLVIVNEKNKNVIIDI
jgi:hypothetical protein